MEMTNKRYNSNTVAMPITAVLIVIAFIIGGARPLNKLRAEAEAVFYNGTGGTVADTFDLSEDLERYAGLAANTLTVAGRYTDTSAEKYSASSNIRLSLLERCSDEGKTARFNETYVLFESINNTNNKITAELLSLSNPGLSDSDRSLLVRNKDDMDSLYKIITRQGEIYNETAESFNKKLTAWPAAFFRITRLVKPLPLFYN